MPGDSDAGTLPRRERARLRGVAALLSLRMTSWRKAPRVTEVGALPVLGPGGQPGLLSSAYSVSFPRGPRAGDAVWEPVGEAGHRAHEASPPARPGPPQTPGPGGPPPGAPGGWASVPRQWWAASGTTSWFNVSLPPV